MTESSEHHFSDRSTSRSLLNEARLADAMAWERLVRLYTPLVASWCRRWRVSEQDIVDVLQDVFSAVASHLSRFRKDRPGDTFRGWLRVIARSKVMDYFNSRNREPAGAGGTEASVRLQEILDPCAIVGMDAEKSAIDEELVFNEVLLRVLLRLRYEPGDLGQ